MKRSYLVEITEDGLTYRVCAPCDVWSYPGYLYTDVWATSVHQAMRLAEEVRLKVRARVMLGRCA
jgi:hypothetical protein